MRGVTATEGELAGRHLPDPEWPGAKPFWDGCRAGELRIPRCERCGRWIWYPAPTCPDCGDARHTWRPTSGGARLFTWVTVRRAFLPGYADRLPYVTALVELSEDPRVRLATFLRDAPAAGLRAGMPMEVIFEPVSERLTLPAFRCVR